MDLKFGMFVHWGPVAIKGTEIGLSRGRQVTIEEITQKSNISPLDLYKLFSGN